MAAGPAQISLKLRVPLLPTYIIRERDGNYRIIIEQPIEFVPTGDSEKDIIALTQMRIDNLEQTIREYTDQWLWTQSRWKKRRHDAVPARS
jgi:lauroyl/myristoyl acyltransferase